MAKKLTEKQKRFCDFYIETGNAAEAARLAGYSERTARQQGQRLLTKVDILEYIQERNEELRNERTADIQEVKEFWTEMMRNEEETGMNRLKASEFLARTEGAFVDKVEHNVTQKSENRIIVESLIKDEDIQQKLIEQFRASSNK